MSQSKPSQSYGPTPEQERASAEQYWNTYSGWKNDELKSYEGDLAKNRARSARSGNTGVNRYEEGRKASYDSSMKGIETGAHGQSLKKYYEKQQQSKINAVTQKYAPTPQPLTGYSGLVSNPDEKTMASIMGQGGNQWASQLGQPSGSDRHRAAYNKQQAGFKARDSQIASIKAESMDDYYTREFGEVTGSNVGSEEQKAIEAAQGRAEGAASGQRQKGSAASYEDPNTQRLDEGQKPLGLANWFA